jgi:hypothetical protein
MADMKITYTEGDKVLVSDERGDFSGTVVGLANKHIFDIYIIELDEPLDGYLFSCVTALYTDMSKVEE